MSNHLRLVWSERIKREQEEEDAAKEKEEAKGEKEAKGSKEKKETEEENDTDEEVVVPEGAAFVASSAGKKYYAIDSAQGKKIKADKRVYFKDEAEAEAAGYGA